MYSVSNVLKAIKTLTTRQVHIRCDRILYDFDKVPLKKILNWLIAEASIWMRPAKPWGWPTHIQIEPSTFCNVRCVFCPVTTGMNREAGNMEFSVFKKLIDEIGYYLFLIILWDWGEPFLNPSIYDMIAYGKQRNIKIISSTNAHIFAKRDHAERLVQSGIDCIICAVDGIHQQTYEKYRAKGNVNTAVEGIKNIVRAKEKFHSKTPFINFRFLAMKHNEHEISKLKEFAESLGVDALSVKTLNPHDHGEFSSSEADGKEFIPQGERYQRFKYDPKTRLRIRSRKNPCKRLWNNPAVHWDGTVVPCTFDPNDSYALGDIKDQSFQSIWFGKSYRGMRRLFRSHDCQDHLCTDCTYAFVGGGHMDRIVDIHFYS